MKKHDTDLLHRLILPLSHKRFPTLLAKDIVDVQPMTCTSPQATYTITQTETMSNIPAVEGVCTCECHQDGQDIFHVYPCCDNCYQKYISISGEVDFERLEELEDDNGV